MLARPPHILVTTPESLYILLTAAKSREGPENGSNPSSWTENPRRSRRQTRRTHLALSLERLDQLAGKRLTRIGLSATQSRVELGGPFFDRSRPARSSDRAS